eukprot:scaffold17263_cov147-Skeletonema_dohrnii-CCMP3373.AAC.2
MKILMKAMQVATLSQGRAGSAHFSLLTSKAMMMKIMKAISYKLSIKDLLTSIEKGGGAGTNPPFCVLIPTQECIQNEKLPPHLYLVYLVTIDDDDKLTDEVITCCDCRNQTIIIIAIVMKIPLLSILLISSCLQLEAIRSSASPAVSEAFCNPIRSNRRRSYAGRNALRSLDKHSTKWSRSSSQLSFATPIHSQNDQHRHNHSLFGRKYCMASSNSLHQTTTNSSTTVTLSLRYALNRIRQFMTSKWSQGLNLLRILTIASILLVPSIASASASSSSPSSYYLQGNPYQTTHQQATTRSEISIQTQPSQPFSNSNTNTVTARRQYPQTTRFTKQRKTTTSSLTQTQKAKQTTLFVMLLTLAASSFRASLLKSKVVRNVTPFGTIRNVSPLGNGVSVIRVCMALKVDGNDEAKRLLNKLYLEEKELYTNISMLSQDDPRVQQPQLSGAYSFRQQALGRYVSNVASTFLQYTNCIRYGNIESIRVPFVEDAVKEFRQVAKEERQVFAATAATQKRKKSVMPEEPKKEKVQRQEEEAHDDANANDSKSSKKKSGYILATILLSIKGDRTSVPLPFGILRQRDVGRALSRIATDAKVEDCLVGSEISWVPNIHTISADDDIDGILLSKKDVLKAFPDLVSLT